MNTHLTSTPARSTPAVAVRDLVKTYPTLDATITAAAGIDLDVSQGSAVAVTGASGSGKSTLLHLIGALDRPDEGTITVHGTDVTNLRGRRAAEYRRGIGFVFQRFNLLPTLSVLDNVTIPQIPCGTAEAIRALVPASYLLLSASPGESRPSLPGCPGGSNNASRSPAR